MNRTRISPIGKGDSIFRRKADYLFGGLFRGKPCEVCASLGRRNCYDTAGHHIIHKSRSRLLRYDLQNIVTVCPDHHTTGNDICPHSSNNLAVELFDEWVQNNRPEDWQYLQEHKNDYFSGSSYREQYTSLRASMGSSA